MMEDEFDIGAAMDDITDGLGLEPKGNDDGLDLDSKVNLPGGDAPDSGRTAGAPPVSPDAKVDGTGAPVPADGTAAPGAPKPGADGSVPPAPGPGAPAADTAPRTWTPAAAEKWATLDPVIKAEIQKREQDMFTGIETYKQDASWGKGIKNLLGPYLPIMQQHNIDPMEQVGNLMNAHYTLATGSAEAKGALLGKLLAEYKIDPNLVPLPGQEEPYVDPEVKALRTRTQALESAEQQRVTDQVERSKAEQSTAIERFFADAKNIHVGEVGYDMAKLIETGVAKDLEDAYERAIWNNPVTRDKEIGRRNADTAANQKAADEAKAAEARKASGANVRARPKSGSAAAPLGSMDDTMNTVLADIRSRS